MVKRIAYPVEVKEEAIKMKLKGKTTSEIMNKLNIRNKTQVKIKKEKRPGSIYFKTTNVIDRDFSSSKPLEKVTTDITYLDYVPKRLYLSSIMDLFNGEILSYTISEK
ncbi:hypothetical protein [Vagococcus martis]|uniref:hypothetical protein n=1 Tax=Vagococcus martis TaxID=1768210 RepID=UPI0009A3A656|nr:hypothetical protein [Vagococcus martis]